MLWFPTKILEVLLPNIALLHSLFILCLGNMAEEKETGFNPETYTHVLPEGVPDFDDYTEEDLQQDPELGLTDEQVAAEVAKLSEEDKKLYEQVKTFMDSFYRQHGYIIPIIDLIQITMTKRYPGFPTQAAEQQEELRQELMQEIRKRKASEEANVEEAPPRKVRRIETELLPKKIIDITGEDDPDKPTVVTIALGEDPYEQLDAKEGELMYTVGDETKSDIHPDDAEGDDLSVNTIDSLKELDSEKVREIWKGMAEVKEKEREYYNSLAAMVDDMTPNDIYATIQATPRLGNTLPQCAEDLLEELGNEELFQRVLAVGYMSWQRFEANRTKKQLNPYEPSSVMKVAEKFGVSSSRIMDLQRGEAITREQTRMKKMLKAEKKERRKRGSPGQSQGLPLPRQPHHKPAPPSSDLTKLGPFGTTDSRSFQDHHNFPRETPLKS